MDVVFIFPVPLISLAILMISARVDKKIKNELDSLTDGKHVVCDPEMLCT